MTQPHVCMDQQFLQELCGVLACLHACVPVRVCVRMCARMCVCVLASAARSVKDILAPTPLVSVVATTSGRLSSRHTGGGHTAATHAHKTHTA